MRLCQPKPTKHVPCVMGGADRANRGRRKAQLESEDGQLTARVKKGTAHASAGVWWSVPRSLV
eukprot:594952-Prymnesium_polylepis.1